MTPEQKMTMVVNGTNPGELGLALLTSQSNLLDKIKNITKDLKDWDDYSLDAEDVRKLDKLNQMLTIDNKAFVELHDEVKQSFSREEQKQIDELIGTINSIQTSILEYVSCWQLANDQQI